MYSKNNGNINSQCEQKEFMAKCQAGGHSAFSLLKLLEIYH